MECRHGELFEDRPAGGLAQAGGQVAVGKELLGAAAQFSGVVREKAAHAVDDRRGRMTVAHHRQAGGHRLERGHVVSVLAVGPGGVNVEAMAAEDALQVVPTVGGADVGQVRVVGVVPHQADRQAPEGLLVEVPHQDVSSVLDVVRDPQARGRLAAVGRVVVGIDGKGDDVLGQSPTGGFQVRAGHGVAADEGEVLAKHRGEFLGWQVGVFFSGAALEGGVDDDQSRTGQMLDVQQVRDVVGDDAVVRLVAGEHLVQRDNTGVGGNRAHLPVPGLLVPPGEAHDHVHLPVQPAQLVDPRLVTVEHQQALAAVVCEITHHHTRGPFSVASSLDPPVDRPEVQRSSPNAVSHAISPHHPRNPSPPIPPGEVYTALHFPVQSSASPAGPTFRNPFFVYSL